MADASTGTGASPLTMRPWVRGEVNGAAVLAFAGIAWFGWAQDDPPSTGSPMADPRVRRGYWATVVVEVALIIGGNLLLAAVGHPAYTAAWTLFVVGVHFVPLARIFHVRGLTATGVATVVVAVAAACLGLASDLAPSASAGAGGGVVFLGYAAWVLGRGRQPQPQR